MVYESNIEFSNSAFMQMTLQWRRQLDSCQVVALLLICEKRFTRTGWAIHETVCLPTIRGYSLKLKQMFLQVKKL